MYQLKPAYKIQDRYKHTAVNAIQKSMQRK